MSKDMAQVALQKALENDGKLSVNCGTKKAAIALRFALYNYRKNIKKQLAHYEGGHVEDIVTDYCGLTFTVVEEEGKHLVSIGPTPIFEMFDPDTGEVI